MGSPKVSVIIPHYDTIDYLPRALRSIVRQSYHNIESIVIDSSGDEEVRKIVDKYPNSLYIFQEPKNPAAARNYGIENSSGDIIAFLDADDYWYKDKLELQIPILKRSDVDIVYTDECYGKVDEVPIRRQSLSVETPEEHYIQYFRRGAGVPIRTVAAWKYCFEDMRFDESLLAREDPHLWVRIFKKYRPAKLDRVTAVKVIREGSLTSDIDLVYESELRSIFDLISRHPELVNWLDERRSITHYRYGKQYLNSLDINSAREAFLRAIKANPRHYKAYLLYFITRLPTKAKRKGEIREFIAGIASRIHNN